jgi:glucose-6-phosphate isomerase
MPETSWNTVTGPAYELFFGYPDEEAYASAVEQLVTEEVASGIAGQDPTLWGPEAEEESGRRLAWVALPETSKRLVTEISTLEVELRERGLSRIVLCGMGGSSLAPEVICGAAGVELVVLDSSDPDFVRAALEERLAETVVVVSSKSGGTVETDSQRRAFEKAFGDAGIDPAERIVVVTDPGSPLAEQSEQAGYRTFLADPDVGGRYSALTAFGLVPSGLAGADITDLLVQADQIRPALEADSVDNPGLRLGALLGVANAAGVDKLVLADAGSPHPGLGDWAEQLIAESTGKHGKGILPVVVDSVKAPNFSPSTPDEVLATYGPDPVLDSVPPASRFGASVDAPLGAQFLLWEYATAVAGRMIGINPFDQPDVESAKAAAREMLDGGASEPVPVFEDGPITVYASGSWLPEGTDSAADAVTALLDQLDPEHGSAGGRLCSGLSFLACSIFINCPPASCCGRCLPWLRFFFCELLSLLCLF